MEGLNLAVDSNLKFTYIVLCMYKVLVHCTSLVACNIITAYVSDQVLV